MIGYFFYQGLLLGSPPPQPIELNPIQVEIHFAAHQPMGPVGVHQVGVTQKGDRSGLCCPAQVNHRSPGLGLKIQGPVQREGEPLGSRLPATGGPSSMSSGDVAFLAFPQILQGGVMEPAPDLTLPQTVEVLNGGLEPYFPRRDEHHRYSQAQTQSSDRAKDNGVLVGSLEEGIVVKLGVIGQLHFLSVLLEKPPYPGRRHIFSDKSRCQSPQQGGAVEHVGLNPVL